MGDKMDNLGKYQDESPYQQVVRFQEPEVQPNDSQMDLVAPILRRWYIVLLVFISVCLAGLPAIWLLVKPSYQVAGAIRVAPILENIFTGEADRGEISNYTSFMNTQADMLLSPQVIQRVADDLIEKTPSFFENREVGFRDKLKQMLSGSRTNPEPVTILKQAKFSGAITAVPDRNGELMTVSMKGPDPIKAGQIVDAFIKAYMAVEVASSIEGEGNKLSVLEHELLILGETMQRQRDTILQLGQEYGDTSLISRHDMKLQRVASLLAGLTEFEAEKFRLEAKVQLLEATGGTQTTRPEDLLEMRNDHVNSDPMIALLSKSIAELEQNLIIARQRLAPTNPELQLKSELIEMLKAQMAEQREEIGTTFDNLMEERLGRISEGELRIAQAELEQVAASEQMFKEKLAKEDVETIDLGRKQLAIQDLQDELAMTKETYDMIQRRIQDLTMEQKRPARISVAYNADTVSMQDKRIKLTVALVFGAFAMAMAMALLRDRADKSIHVPDDIVKHVGVRIIGTTTALKYLDKPRIREHLVNEYRTIRVNLGLFDGNGDSRIIVVTSPGVGDGKTTLSVNLATSFAQSGEKVLLIDGDLRRPGIGTVMGIPGGTRGFQDMLFGLDFDKAVYKSDTAGLHILATDNQNMDDTLNLMMQPQTRQLIRRISSDFDHVIIDTPPVLAFSDALVWAKIADAVILTSLANHTSTTDLSIAIGRLNDIGVRLLGTVMQNVKADSSYHRYGYDYTVCTGERAKSKSSKRRGGDMLLLTTESKKTDNNKSDQ